MPLHPSESHCWPLVTTLHCPHTDPPRSLIAPSLGVKRKYPKFFHSLWVVFSPLLLAMFAFSNLALISFQGISNYPPHPCLPLSKSWANQEASATHSDQALEHCHYCLRAPYQEQGQSRHYVPKCEFGFENNLNYCFSILHSPLSKLSQNLLEWEKYT